MGLIPSGGKEKKKSDLSLIPASQSLRGPSQDKRGFCDVLEMAYVVLGECKGFCATCRAGVFREGVIFILKYFPSHRKLYK